MQHRSESQLERINLRKKDYKYETLSEGLTIIHIMKSSISIITVVRNDLDGLKVTAESVLSQNFLEFEWIIIDGNSSDGSYEYAKELTSNDFVTIEQTPPKGIYNAMNHGARKSKTPWLWFINAGDVFLTDGILSQIAEIIKKSTTASVIASPVAYLTPSNKVYSISLPRLVEEKSKQYALFHHQGSIMRRSIFIEVGEFDESYDFAADGKVLDSMILIAKPTIIPLVTVGFEMGGTSSKNFRHSLKEIRRYREAILPTNKVIIYQFKEVIRDLILKGSGNPKFSALLSRYLGNRERSILEKARLQGLQIVKIRDNDLESGN